MSYSAPYLDESGIHLPTYAERLENFIAGYKAIFGDDVYIAEDTMDYQLLSIVAKCWDDLNSVILDVYNSRNPNFATGTALDTLLPLNGLRRKKATPSTVTLKVTGQPGTILEAGMQVRDDQEYLWQTTETVAFSETDGEAYVPAVCLEAGAIPAGIGTITEINTPVLNWYTVTNEEPAALGQDLESDAALRLRRSRSIAVPSMTTLDGMKSAILSLQEVSLVSILENASNYDRAIPAHSIAVVVKGGADEDIAEMIRLKKTPGIATYGTETVIIPDELGYENEIHFSRPVDRPLTIRVKIRWFTRLNNEVMDTLIPEAIQAYVADLNIGDELIAPLLHGTVFAASQTSAPSFSILSITAETAASGVVSDTVSAEYNEIFTMSGEIAVTHVSDMVYEIEVS